MKLCYNKFGELPEVSAVYTRLRLQCVFLNKNIVNFVDAAYRGVPYSPENTDSNLADHTDAISMRRRNSVQLLLLSSFSISLIWNRHYLKSCSIKALLSAFD